MAANLRVSVGIVAKTVLRATMAKLTWEASPRSTRPRSRCGLYGEPGSARPEPDHAWIDIERRKAGVTLELLQKSGFA